ncbi:carbohydrate ABC transporter permease [Paenibacillus sp. HB172176]|uniref:carbohydrate ABC transporter permease n=1 Tax=Paenibacillus sp. HB172176 TaxID=2493690 RepID=UPI0014395B10|nr:carbohydrate ABC transporter permease [Paenibacillus sp. HB172176]
MKRLSKSEYSFEIVNYTLLLVFAAFCIIPFWHLAATSIATSREVLDNSFLMIPLHYTMDAYQVVFSTTVITRAMLNSIVITVIGTLLSIAVSVLMAYALAKRDLVGRQLFVYLVLFAILFNGGIIPTYLVVKELNLLDSYWAIWLSSLVNPFYLIIMRGFFQSFPKEVEEAAKVDGLGDLQLFVRIVLPLSKSTIAAFSLFYAVFYWNNFMQAILYLNDSLKWPIQVVLRQVILVSSNTLSDAAGAAIAAEMPAQSVQSAVVVVATLPILLVYPFLQKHFAKGVLLGSVKG